MTTESLTEVDTPRRLDMRRSAVSNLSAIDALEAADPELHIVP
jgi:hypothetical protein